MRIAQSPYVPHKKQLRKTKRIFYRLHYTFYIYVLYVPYKLTHKVICAQNPPHVLCNTLSVGFQ